MKATIVRQGYVNRKMIYVDVVVDDVRHEVGTNDRGNTWSTVSTHGAWNTPREDLARATATGWGVQHPDEMRALGREIDAREKHGAIIDVIKPYVEGDGLVLDFRLRPSPGRSGPKFKGKSRDWIAWEVQAYKSEDQAHQVAARELITAWAATHPDEHQALVEERDDLKQ